MPGLTAHSSQQVKWTLQDAFFISGYFTMLAVAGLYSIEW
jgi:hypothetical protein